MPAPWLFLDAATEFALLTDGEVCALHRLLTLSDLFAMALWTKLPTPFVGEPGLPNVAEL